MNAEHNTEIIDELLEAIRILRSIPWRKLTVCGIVFEQTADGDDPFKWTWGDNIENPGGWRSRVYRHRVADEVYTQIADQISEVRQLVRSLPHHACFLEIRRCLERLLAVTTFRYCTPKEIEQVENELRTRHLPPVSGGSRLFQYTNKPRQELQELWQAVQSALRRQAGLGPSRPDDQPDDNGYVRNPDDPDTYLPASDVLSTLCQNLPFTAIAHLRAVVEDFETNRVRWTRPPGRPGGDPHPKRLSIHIGDWMRYRKRRQGAGFVDPTPEEIEDAKQRILRNRNGNTKIEPEIEK